MSASDTIANLRTLLPGCLVADRLWAGPRLEQAARRLQRGAPADRALTDLADRLQASHSEVERRGALPLVIQYPELPVSARRDEILASLARLPALVLTGETGSGKTTQLPKMLLEAGYGRRGMIALTQPRRVAAQAMARRLREECQAGEGVVGHSVRFDDQAGADTVVRVMTDGLLLAEAANDPLLSRYDAIMVDEAHERSLNIDLLLGILKRLRTGLRPDLCLVVSSASIEAQRFADYFSAGDEGGERVPVLTVTGRTYPVEIIHRAPADEDVGYLGLAVDTVRELAGVKPGNGPDGDVLVFLPTERDILEATRRLKDLPGCTVLPLFSRLPPGEQQRVFQPARGRKVVLTTNIAETSLTIPGITHVVDTGLARLKRYQAGTRTERLPIEAVAQASCVQRAGRAGRVAPGVCVRLYSEEDFKAREVFTSPEILRSNLAGVVLTCLHMGLGDPEQFSWLDAPAPGAWFQARKLLEELGAFAERAAVATRRPSEAEEHPVRAPEPGARTLDAGLSAMGRQLAALPADPQVGRILLAGIEEGVAHEACTIAAFLSVQDPRVRPPGHEAQADASHQRFRHEAGDLASLLKLWDAWQTEDSNSKRSRFCDGSFLGWRRMREWGDVRHQLWSSLRQMRGVGARLPGHGYAAGEWPLDRVHRAVLAGMLGNVLMYDKENRCYRGAGDRQLWVHPGSNLRAGKAEDGKRAPAPPPWLVACEVAETSRLYARLCAPIDPEWVVRLAGERVKRRHREPRWVPARQQVACIETITWKGLPIRDGRLVPYERVDPAHATDLFVSQRLCQVVDDEDDSGARPGRAPRPPTPDEELIESNRVALESCKRLRHRLRDAHLWIDESHLEAFYRKALGLEREPRPVIASSDAFRRFLSVHGYARLRLTPAHLLPPAAAERAATGFPEEARWPGGMAPLTYRFIPGDEHDGATFTISDTVLASLPPHLVDWLVPGWIGESVGEYLQQLPKDARRRLIPFAETVKAVTAAVLAEAGTGPLDEVLTRVVVARYRLERPTFAPEALPVYLRLRFVVRADDGTVVYEGRDRSLVFRQGLAGSDRLALLRLQWDTPPAAVWPGDCPVRADHGGIIGHVGLARSRAADGSVAARRTVYAHPLAASAWHQDGLDALLEATLARELEAIAAAPLSLARSAQWEKALGGTVGGLRRQLALGAALAGRRSAVTELAGWDELCVRVRAQLLAAAPVLDQLVADIADLAEQVRARTRQGARSLAAAGAMRVAVEDLERLLAPGWGARLGWNHQQRLPLYLGAVLRRLDAAQKDPQGVARLLDRMLTVEERCDALPPDALRWCTCLGRLAEWRELMGLREEHRLALAVAGSGSGFAEGHLLQALAALTKHVADARRRVLDARDRLVAVRPLIDRLPPGAARDRLRTDLDRHCTELPDLSLGADLELQVETARTIALRVEGLVARI